MRLGVIAMSRVEVLEREVEKLSPKELAVFRRWFAEYAAEQWDRQIAKDAKTGKLDALAERALAAHRRGESREI